MEYFEIKTDANSRPDFIEDNTFFIKAKSIENAIELISFNRGAIKITGSVISVRKVYCIYDFNQSNK